MGSRSNLVSLVLINLPGKPVEEDAGIPILAAGGAPLAFISMNESSVVTFFDTGSQNNVSISQLRFRGKMFNISFLSVLMVTASNHYSRQVLYHFFAVAGHACSGISIPQASKAIDHA